MINSRRHSRHSHRFSLPYPNPSLGEMATPINNPYAEIDDDLRGPGTGPANLGPSLGATRQACLVVCLLMGMLMSCVDTSIVSTSLVRISQDFQNYFDAPWVVLAYLLTYMGFSIFIAKLSDLFGRRNMLLVSWALFIAFSFCCGQSKNMTQLIIFRALQGLGGSGLYTLTQVAIVEVGPVHRPGLMGALIGATLSISFVLGPILGGTITDKSSWPWIFYINMPIGLVTIIGLMISWPPEDSFGLFTWQKVASIDFLGGLSLFAATSFLVYGIQQSGSEDYIWGKQEVIIAFALAVLFWVVFFTWQIILGFRNFARIEPVFPIRLVFRRVYICAFLVTLCTGFCFISLTVTIPERFQIVNGDDPMLAGVHLLPMLGACAFGSFAAGAACSKRNNSSIVLIIASMLQIIGMGLLSSITAANKDARAQYGYQTIYGLGCGLSLGASTIMASVESAIHGDLASAQGAIAQVRVLGGCLGISICTVVFNQHANYYLKQYLTPEQLQELRHDLTELSFWPAELIDSIKMIYAEAFAAENQIMMYLCAFMVVYAVFTWQRHPLSLQEALAGGRQDSHTAQGRADVEAAEARRTIPRPRFCNFSRKVVAGARAGCDGARDSPSSDQSESIHERALHADNTELSDMNSARSV